jgi:putative transport protein
MASSSDSYGSSRVGSNEAPRTATWIALGLATLVGLVTLLLVVARERGGPLPGVGALFEFLNEEPFILLFATMAGGYALGKFEFKGLSLGPTAGSLVVGIGLSTWASGRHGVAFELPTFASTLFFNLFMFAIGMKVGPQFLAGLQRGAKNYLILALVVPLVAAGLVIALKVWLEPPPGVAAGIFAGSNTATPGLAAASAAFASGAVQLPGNVSRTAVMQDLSTAFACSYCVSAVLFVVFLKVLPRLFGRDARAEARVFEREIAGSGAALPGAAASFWPGTLPVQQRTYRVEGPSVIGKSLATLRAEQPLYLVEHLTRDGATVPVTDDTELRKGDLISIFARVPLLVEAQARFGPEIYQADAPQRELETVEVVQKNPAAIGLTLSEMVKDLGHGLYLNAMFRGGNEVPRGPDVVIQQSDVLRVTASPERIERLERELGPVVRPSLSTDLLTLALGLCTGALIGAITIPIGKIEFTLGSLALLLVGIAFSTLRTRNPALGGPFPEPARQLLEDLGLNVFVVVLGLNSGAGVMRAVEAGALGPALFATLLVGLVPALVAWLVGLYVLKMNSAELLGGVSGARCASSALRSAQEVTESTVPAVAYPVTYAVASLLLTLLTYVLALME